MLRLTAGVGVGLLFIVGPVSDLYRSSMGTARVAVTTVLWISFVALYVLTMRAGYRLRLGPRATLAFIAALLVLPIVMLSLGAPGSFAILFVYFVAAAGMRLRADAALVIVVATAVGVGIAATATGSKGDAVASYVLVIVAIGTMMTAFNRQIRVNRELQAARHELARFAVTDERLRIARDLHDLLGHSLSVINLKSELAAKLVETDAKRAAAELADVQAVGRQALAEVREAVQGYRQLALVDALAGAQSALAAAGIAYEVDGAQVRLPADVDEVFAWAVREGTTNVLRHSGAAHCAVRISDRAGEATLVVEDDGAASSQAAPAGSGLAGLSERAARLRGRLEAGPRPDGGFRLQLVVPVSQ
ncbi:MAG: sensor histidine kinase [Actinobacteria bacterium]|nr:sensor histidine kinase [Actinomycetota bacterium]